MMFKAVFWVILPCKMIFHRRFRGAYNHFPRQYNPEDSSEQIDINLRFIAEFTKPKGGFCNEPDEISQLPHICFNIILPSKPGLPSVTSRQVHGLKCCIHFSVPLCVLHDPFHAPSFLTHVY
jgi:hypothetical protein